jgi:hypothetical protein
MLVTNVYCAIKLQDVDEPWPLEVIGHDGKAYNVTMEPGDLVLYESHSILHGVSNLIVRPSVPL